MEGTYDWKDLQKSNTKKEMKTKVNKQSLKPYTEKQE